VAASHSSTQELESYVDGKLSTERSAEVHIHLEECEECQIRLADIALQAQWKGPERRREPRVPVSFAGRLKLLDPVTSIGPPHDIEVIEISIHGLKIRTPRPLLAKTLVQIRFDNKTLLGEVRYCMRVDSEYHAGIKQVHDFASR
jgi:hypothetical protein